MKALLTAVSVSHGADARAEDVHGNTPAHLAASKGHLAILTALLQVTKHNRIMLSWCGVHTLLQSWNVSVMFLEGCHSPATAVDICQVLCASAFGPVQRFTRPDALKFFQLTTAAMLHSSQCKARGCAISTRMCHF